MIVTEKKAKQNLVDTISTWSVKYRDNLIAWLVDESNDSNFCPIFLKRKKKDARTHHFWKKIGPETIIIFCLA